jgi:hypothetical protein
VSSHDALGTHPTQASNRPRGRRLLSAQHGSVALAAGVLVATRRQVFAAARISDGEIVESRREIA